MSEQPPEWPGDGAEFGPPGLMHWLETEYLVGTSHSDVTIAWALRAEAAAQRSVCNVPAADADWPNDLLEALCRRVAHNLAMRPLPLGVMETVSDAGAATTRIGGTDPEVRRLEAPYRKRKLA